MRKLLISLSALVLVAFPVRAQTPVPQHGLKAGYIALVVTGEVLPGQMDNFRQLVPRLVAAVAEEPGTLVYEWSFHPDQKTYNVMEVYQKFRCLSSAPQTFERWVPQRIRASSKDHERNCFWFAGCAGQGGSDPPRSCIHVSH